MTRWLLAGLLAWAACAGVLAAPVAPQQFAARQTVTLDQPGAIAAFAVDSTIVDVAVAAGRVVLLGRRSGETVVTVVFAGSVQSFSVRVEPAALSSAAAQAELQGRTMVEGRYDSALRRFTAVVSGGGRLGDSEVRAHVEAVHQGDPAEGERRVALPSASIAISNGQRSIVLLDQFVQVSPLTLNGIVLRGVHVQQGPFDLHAGIASWSPLQGFLVPEGERAATVSRRFEAGGVRITPHVAWFPDSQSGARGVAAVAIEFGAPEDELRVRGDVGWGGAPAAAIDVDWRTTQREVWLRGATRPEGFASLKAAPPPGTSAEGAWTEKLAEGTTVTASGSVSRLQLAQAEAQAISGRLEGRHQLTPEWSATVAASGGQYRIEPAEAVRRSTLAAGLAWDTNEWGASAQYRYQTVSSSDRGGHGGRLSLRANAAGWRATAFIDAQQQAPTLDLLLADRSELARALANLGIVAAQPEDLLRALRDNASLSELASAIGPVRLNPLRTQAGLDVSWRGDGPNRPEYGLRLLRDHVDGVVGARSSTVASLHANWRIGQRTDVGIAVSRWSTRREGQETIGDAGVQVTVRTYLDQPLIPGPSSDPISGRVYRDDAPGGGAGARVPMAGIEVVLDRNRRTHTDPEGRYSFARPGPGPHTVEAILPAQESAYFTTASQLTREAGGTADFGLALSGVRIAGVVLNDAGAPVAGVTVRVDGARPATAVTDSSGSYRATVAPGDVQVTLAAETVPPGHDLRALSARSRKLADGEPATVNFTVRALRSLEGEVTGHGGAAATVTIPELSRSVTADAQGRFILRRLPAGPLTLVVNSAGRAAQTVVEMPAGPGTVRGVKLQLP